MIEIHQLEALEPAYIRPLQGGRAQGAHDRGAGAVAARVDDAMASMARFAAEQWRAVRTEVEGRAEVAQPGDPRCSRLGDERDDVGLAQFGTHANRVGGVQGRGVVAADRGGDAALREAGRTLADRAVGDEHAILERERGREARDAAADDDGRRLDEIVDDHGLTASIRVTARRARSATAAGTFTS